jgi:FkbM family methyltransferase
MPKNKKLHPSDAACLDIGRIVIGAKPHEVVCIFDVGANEGLFARRVVDQWQTQDMHIHCFEPNPKAYETLTKILSDQQNFTLLDIGLSGEEGTGTLYHPEKKTVLSSLVHREIFGLKKKQWGETLTCTVQLSTLDSYCSLSNISQVDYLKIDTEGFELEVLKGSAKALGQKSVVCGQLEYGGTFSDRGISVSDVAELLFSHGYVLFDLMARKEIDANYEDDFTLNNLFFCQSSKKELVENWFLQSDFLNAQEHI